MLKKLVAIVSILMVSACASVAPPYRTTLNATNELKDANTAKVKVGEFKEGGAKPEELNRLTIRGGSFASPVNNSYAAYLKKALADQLADAGRLDPNATIELSGVLLKNDINAAGTELAFADISARFVVNRSGQSAYDKTLTIHHEWKSAFDGASAIPLAHQNYMRTVQKLVEKLMSDPSFLSAVK